jgi:hypothetical protein
MGRLNFGQRIVIVIGLAAVLLTSGEWAMTWGTRFYSGWTGYAPLYTPYEGGLYPWARLLVWLGLTAIWVGASVALLRTPGLPTAGGDSLLNRFQRVVLVAGNGFGLYLIGAWISAGNFGGYGVPRRVFSYNPEGPSRWQPWQLLLWLGLTSIWVLVATWILRSRRFAASSSEGPDE